MKVLHRKVLTAAELRLRDDGILEHRFHDESVLTLAGSEELIEYSLSIVDGSMPVLAVGTRIRHVERDARIYLTRGLPSRRLTRRLAMIAGTPVSRIVGNIFLGLNKPPFPTQLFTDEERAAAWLLDP